MHRKNTTMLEDEGIIRPSKKLIRSTRHAQSNSYPSSQNSESISKSNTTRRIDMEAYRSLISMSTSQDSAKSIPKTLKVLDLTNIEQSTRKLAIADLCALELDIHMNNTLTQRLPFNKGTVPLDLLAKVLRRTAESEAWFANARIR